MEQTMLKATVETRNKLKEISLARKLAGIKPNTMIDIVEELINKQHKKECK